MSPGLLQFGRRRALQRRIAEVELRLQSRRSALRTEAGGLGESLRAALTSPLMLLLAAGVGFVAVQAAQARDRRLPRQRTFLLTTLRVGLLVPLWQFLRAAGWHWLTQLPAPLQPEPQAGAPSVPVTARTSVLRSALLALALVALGAGLMSPFTHVIGEMGLLALPVALLVIAGWLLSTMPSSRG
jgi:hypothetical protein